MHFDFFDTVSFGFTVLYNGLDITPYQQIVGWINPSASILGGKTPDFSGHGRFLIDFGRITTTYQLGAPSFDVSIVDIVSDLVNGTAPTLFPPVLEAPTPSTYRDNQLSMDLSALVDDSKTWFGTPVYLWETSLFGTIALDADDEAINTTDPNANATIPVIY